MKFNLTSRSILVYPPNGPGAVHVTNGDLMRLEPGEFLNDTLIELGLKYVPSLFVVIMVSDRSFAPKVLV